jgi:hypothetical protein
MSSVSAAGSIASQPPVAPVQPVRAQQPEAVAQRIADDGTKLTATAVAAQVARPATNEAGKGLIVDFQV